jgi:hypothetical protein
MYRELPGQYQYSGVSSRLVRNSWNTALVFWIIQSILSTARLQGLPAAGPVPATVGYVIGGLIRLAAAGVSKFHR